MVINITDKYTLAIELIPWIIDSYTMQEIFYMYSSLQNSDLLQSWYWLPGELHQKMKVLREPTDKQVLTNLF